MQIFGLQCNTCGDRIFSIARHDFVSCRCRETSVDGGQDFGGRMIGSNFEETLASPEEAGLLAKKVRWQSVHGGFVAFGQAEATHLNNIIWFLRAGGRSQSFVHYAAVLEMEARGYDPAIIGVEQIPFEKDGKWLAWNPEKKQLEETAKPKKKAPKKKNARRQKYAPRKNSEA